MLMNNLDDFGNEEFNAKIGSNFEFLISLAEQMSANIFAGSFHCST